MNSTTGPWIRAGSGARVAGSVLTRPTVEVVSSRGRACSAPSHPSRPARPLTLRRRPSKARGSLSQGIQRLMRAADDFAQMTRDLALPTQDRAGLCSNRVLLITDLCQAVGRAGNRRGPGGRGEHNARGGWRVSLRYVLRTESELLGAARRPWHPARPQPSDRRPSAPPSAASTRPTGGRTATNGPHRRGHRERRPGAARRPRGCGGRRAATATGKRIGELGRTAVTALHWHTA